MTPRSRAILVGTALAVTLGLAGCRGGGCGPAPKPARTLSVGCDASGDVLDLDRGDWLVSQDRKVWKVLEERGDALPSHIGYLVAHDYRQMRGGPSYRVYKVTTLNRREEIGTIDQIGRALRYVPQRNGGFEPVDVGVGRLEDSVGAIFQTSRPITLQATTERRLAFEALDRNRSGVLEAEETANAGDRIQRADTNRDGVVDFQEFDALDVL